MVLSLEKSELEKFEKHTEEDEVLTLQKPSVEQDKAALDDLLGFLDDWEKEDEDFEELEPTDASNIVSIPKSIGIGIDTDVKEAETIGDIEKLIEKGVAGLEIQPNYGNQNDMFKEYAEKKGLLMTYGSDYHGARLLERPLLGRKGNFVKKFWS